MCKILSELSRYHNVVYKIVILTYELTGKRINIDDLRSDIEKESSKGVESKVKIAERRLYHLLKGCD